MLIKERWLIEGMQIPDVFNWNKWRVLKKESKIWSQKYAENKKTLF